LRGDLYSPRHAQHARSQAETARVIPQSLEPRWYALAIIGTALGVLGQAWYGYQGRVTGYPSSVEWYASLCLVFTPSALVILSRRTTKIARIGFTLYVSLALLATRFMLYPTMFVYHDEIVHEWNVITMDKTDHLFSSNAILPVTPYYPGLEIATSAVEHLTGLPLHQSATVVLFLLRVVMTLGLVQIFQMISRNVLISTMGALIYIANPQYLFFNSEFSYQTVALPLCFFCIYVFSIRSRHLSIWGVAPGAAVAAAIAVSHHLTSVALAVTLWTWYLYTRIKKRPEPNLALLAILSTFAIVAWTWVARKEVIPYISGIVQKNIGGINGLLSGATGHKLFSDSAGDKAPEWEVLLSLASILLICLTMLPAGWYVFKRRRSLSAASLTLATAAALYPIVPAGHLAAATGEAADRASGFIFVGLAFIVASWWHSPHVQRLYSAARERLSDASRPPRVQRLYWAARERLSDASRRYRPSGQFRMPRIGWLLIVALTICFAGGVVDGSGPNWAYGPGVYLVSADNRSVDQLALQAAYWEGQHLPAGSRVFTDRVNALLAQTYGRVGVLTSLNSRILEGSVSQLLLAPSTVYDVQIACDNRVQFLVADQRLSTSLPHLGLYIDSGEYLLGSRTAPPPASALVKFDGTPGAERIFDNGAIKIYNLEGLACQR
jgi:hypothetical protein